MRTTFALLCLLVMASLACGLGVPQPVDVGATSAAPTAQSELSQPSQESENSNGPSAVLYFTIGMHIEPMGETAQGYGGRKGDYHQKGFFERHVQDILAVTQIVESHGGRITIQAQSPFTSVAIESGNTILVDLASRGHEIALHFHEDAHLGKNANALPVEEWCDIMKEEITLIQQASGESNIRYWSGGNLYISLYEAAECAGLDVNSDWKNPRTQETLLELVGVNPWRPSGGTDGVDLTSFVQNDPDGAVIFLPEGQYDKTNFASMRRSDAAGGNEAYFEYLKTQFYASLHVAQADKVNVFHFTVHPGEFRGNLQHPFEVIENFLTEVVDPAVASGDVQWATFSQMADAYMVWETVNTSVNPNPITLLPAAIAPTPSPYEIPLLSGRRGYITFVVNVHDWNHPSESADILIRLVDLFEKYNVRGDFYFTAEVIRKFVEERPDVIERYVSHPRK